jgi:hypothetical protein
MQRQELIRKMEELPPERLAKVEDSVESLARRGDDLNRGDLHQALSDYATQYAGTEAVYDVALEAASVELFIKVN